MFKVMPGEAQPEMEKRKPTSKAPEGVQCQNAQCKRQDDVDEYDDGDSKVMQCTSCNHVFIHLHK